MPIADIPMGQQVADPGPANAHYEAAEPSRQPIENLICEEIMRLPQYIIAISMLVVGAMAPTTGSAQAAMPSGEVSPAQATTLTDGEVKKIDAGAGKITLRHGEIQQLDMPGMTMVYEVKDKVLLNNVKAGDKVKFSITVTNGKMLVTAIQPVP